MDFYSTYVDIHLNEKNFVYIYQSTTLFPRRQLILDFYNIYISSLYFVTMIFMRTAYELYDKKNSSNYSIKLSSYLQSLRNQ